MNALLIVLGALLLASALMLFIVSLQARRAFLRQGSLIAFAIGILFIVLGFTVISVGANEKMVVFNRVRGEFTDPRGPGFVFVNPLTTSYRIYDISRQNYTMSAIFFEGDVQGDDAITARTADGQEITLDVTTLYRINPDRVNDVHVNWPNDRYRAEFIRPLLRSAVRDAVSLFPVEEIYQERATIDEEIEQVVIPALEKEGFILEDILVRNVTFSDEYITAIELAQVAEVQIREQEFRVQQAEQEAEQVRVRAQGQADARVIQAQAEAQALQLVADVLAQNPQLIEYQYVQNLSDQVEVLALPSTSPYIFDLSNFINRPVSPDGN